MALKVISRMLQSSVRSFQLLLEALVILLAAYKTLLVEGELYLCVNFGFHFNQLGLKVFLIHLS